ncbi:hypothetical protein BGX31_011150, partial [Mortierella sp. GBA43]
KGSPVPAGVRVAEDAPENAVPSIEVPSVDNVTSEIPTPTTTVSAADPTETPAVDAGPSYDVYSGDKKTLGNQKPKQGPKLTDAPTHVKRRGLVCSIPAFIGSKMTIRCAASNTGYNVWVECTDGYRYTTDILLSVKNIQARCPAGCKPTKGGADLIDSSTAL